MSARQFVFGYGSLAADLDGTVARLRGHRREWGVAMDNSRNLAGYKHYLLRSDASRPQVYVVFLDLVRDAGSSVNGVLVPVDAAALNALDRRERNYQRVDVTGAVAVGDADAVGDTIADTDATATRPPPGTETGTTPGTETPTIWVYVGTPEGRTRLREARRRGRAVISRDYVADVKSGFAAMGPKQLAAFERSTAPADLPIWDLERIAHGGRSPLTLQRAPHRT